MLQYNTFNYLRNKSTDSISFAVFQRKYKSKWNSVIGIFQSISMQLFVWTNALFRYKTYDSGEYLVETCTFEPKQNHQIEYLERFTQYFWTLLRYGKCSTVRAHLFSVFKSAPLCLSNRFYSFVTYIWTNSLRVCVFVSFTKTSYCMRKIVHSVKTNPKRILLKKMMEKWNSS